MDVPEFRPNESRTMHEYSPISSDGGALMLSKLSYVAVIPLVST